MIVIQPCLLDTANQMPAGALSAGEQIRAAAKEHLWSERPAGTAIDTIVIHYMSASGIAPAAPFDRALLLAIFCSYSVSSHYCIERDGVILALVPEEYAAWHCGGSIMPEPDNRLKVNEFSIGIELVATSTSGFTTRQYNSLAGLCREIEARHPIAHYVGHDDIAGERAVGMGLRKDIKHDPGEKFDWPLFNRLRSSR
jgi:N-acetyl-anhydromuramyl-L-alanine amidase AmpD